MNPATRLNALDGLRGVAAFVVLLHHGLLTMPNLAAAYFGGQTQGTLAVLLAYSPLHLIWAGTEAVYLFFILSGFVLVRMAIKTGFSYESYLSSRIVRIYVPVIAAVFLGWILFQIVPRVGGGVSPWIQVHPLQYPVPVAIQDALLVSGTSSTITPLWSLTWEILFSLALPAYVVVARRLNVFVAVGGAILICWAGSWLQIQALMYLPMFAIGAALAAHSDALTTTAGRLLSAGRFMNLKWAGLTIAALLLASVRWLLGGAADSTLPVILLGLTLLMVVVLNWRPLQRILSSAPLMWAGRISFSLYLVHEPILVAASYLFPDSRLAMAAAVLGSVAVAWLFWFVVERNAHLLSRRIRNRETVVLSA